MFRYAANPLDKIPNFNEMIKATILKIRFNITIIISRKIRIFLAFEMVEMCYTVFIACQSHFKSHYF